MVAPTPNDALGGPRAELFVLSGPDVGRSFAIAPGATIGRAPDRDVILRDRSISRHHAHFEQTGGTWFLVDDGSTNGFLVDGERRTRAALTDLRDFLIGEILVRLRTQVQDGPAPSAAPPAPEPVRPRASEELVIEDEIVLDEAPPPARAPRPLEPAPPVPPRVEAPPRTAAAGLPSRAAGDPGMTARGQKPLQFHKEDARQGLLVTDLEQQPAWVRALLILVVAAAAALLAWGVYRGVLSLREGGAGSSDATEDS